MINEMLNRRDSFAGKKPKASTEDYVPPKSVFDLLYKQHNEKLIENFFTTKKSDHAPKASKNNGFVLPIGHEEGRAKRRVDA